MKFTLLVVALLALVAENDAFFGRFGLGFRRFGLGFGGLGFRRFGFGFPGLPIPMPVPVPVPVPVPAPVPVPFGKRSSMEVMNSTETMCTIESFFGSNSTLECMGPEHNFECALERKFNLTHLEHELEGLRILPMDWDMTKTLEKTILLSVETPEMAFNNFTLEHHNETMLFSIFHDETFENDGFRIASEECWNKFSAMLEHDLQAELKMKLDF